MPGGEGDAGSVIIVAASDSSASAKAQAQYVCDGVNDHAEIQAALNALPSGGTVLLMEGTFVCAGDVMPGASTTLKGQGPDTTILKFPGTGGLKIRSEYVTFADFKVTGTADLHITESHARIHDVTMTVDNSRTGAFYVWAQDDVVEDIEFVNCKAIDCGRYGFLNSGAGSPRLIKNIRYINCEAINCGRDSYVRTGPWVAGFDIVEKNDIQDCQVIGCRAEGNQESGFHLEGFDYLNIENVTFRDCVSINNAQKGKDEAWFGGGFTVSKGVTLENCSSANNKYGFLISGGETTKGHDVAFFGCVDEGSDYGIMIRNGYNYHLTDCESRNANFQSIFAEGSHNIQIKNFKAVSVDRTGGQSSKAEDISSAFLKNCSDICFSGDISTDRTHPLAITGRDTRNVTVQDLTICSEGTTGTAYGVYINPDVASADTVQFLRCTIYDPAKTPTLDYGIANTASKSVKVADVLVTGAMTDFVNCDVISMPVTETVPPGTGTPTETPIPGFIAVPTIAGLAIVLLLIRRRR